MTGVQTCALPILFLYFLTKNTLVLCCGLLYAAGAFGCLTLFLAFIRRKLTLFSDALCKQLDDMMSSDREPPQYAVEENLFYKIQHRLSRLYEVLREGKSSIAKERADLQELISDISHQVKTPIANLKMIDATLLEQTVSPEKQREFLCAMGRKERIMVYGDYDVDGTTAVALVYKFLQQFYSNIDYYIPDRKSVV